MTDEKIRDWVSYQIKKNTVIMLEKYRLNPSDSINDIIERVVHEYEKAQLENELLKSKN